MYNLSKIYGVIYKITNKENNRVYIGQSKHSFKKRYGGLTIKHVYKKSHNDELKRDIEKYNDDKYWLIEPEFDIAYSAEDLNEKESSLFMQYMWDNMTHKKRKDLHRCGDNEEEEEENMNIWYSWDRCIPQILYNQVKPTHKRTRDRTKRYIYTTDKIPIMFTSKMKLKDYIDAQDEHFHGKGRFTYRSYLGMDGGCFYIHWDSKWRLVNHENIPRVKNIKRCIRYSYFSHTKVLYSKLDESKPLVIYTGSTYSIRKIYKPCRKIFIYKFEVKK